MKRGLKKVIRNFIIDEHGAVSIYLIIAIICLFFFNAVLIDYARILVAERQTERAAKKAVRSTMASFDPALHSYGLFGLDAPHPTRTFRKVFAKNLSIQQSGFFHFTDTKMVKSKTRITVNHSKMLSNEYTFKHQILENMKYRAPISFTNSIIDGFLKVSKAMKEASTFADIASDIDKKAQKRKNALDQAKNALLKARAALQGINHPVHGKSRADFPEVRTLSDIVAHEETYKEIMSPDQGNKDGGKAEERKKFSKADARTFERQSQALVTGLRKNVKTAKVNLNKALDQMKKAKKQNEKIKSTIARKRKQKQNDYASAEKYEQKYGKHTGAMNSAEKNLKNANRKLDDYVMKDSFFTKTEKKIRTALDRVDSGDRSLADSLNLLDRVIPYDLDHIDQSRLSIFRNKVEGIHRDALDDAQAAAAYFESHRKTYKDKDTQKKEDQANERLKKNKKTLDQLMKEAKSIAGDTQVYQTLQKLVKKYEGQSSGKPKKANMKDPSETADDAMAMMDKLFNEIGQALEKERNKIYINEYILTRFKSHDFTIKGTAANNFENNQVEYIIYGIPAHGANYAAALGELFVIRFAINFVEAFTRKSVEATGPFMFWAALAYALLQTSIDLDKLTNGKKIRFFGRLRYVTDYKDYLRLFLFFHTRGNKLQRVMAVIDENTGTDLTKVPTYETGTATSSIRLWFIPGVEKVLSKTHVLNGQVKGRKFYITKTAVYSY